MDPLTIKLYEALRGLLDIGKRDLRNEKYDEYFIAARAAVWEYERAGAPPKANMNDRRPVLPGTRS